MMDFEADVQVSVIVPARDAAALLPACLGALQKQVGLSFGVDFEVIVVDDGSRDATADVARACGARVISQPNAGPASARNSGVRAARAALVAFTDADCIPAEDWLCQMLAPFEDLRVMGVKGVYRTRERGLVPRFVQVEYASKYARMQRQDQIDFVDTYAAAYRRQVFVENQGFDEIFPAPSVEDQEFSFRLARKGYRLVFQPQAAVYHRHDLNLIEYVERKFGIGYWKAVMLNWLPEKAFGDSHTPLSQRMQLLLLAGCLGCLGIGLFWPPALWAGLALLAVFVLSAGPFLAYAARTDRAVLWVALPLLLARAMALGAGLAAGFLTAPGRICRVRKGL